MGGVVVPPILDSFFQVCFLGEFRSIFVNEDEKAPQKKPADVRHVKVHQEMDFSSFVFGVSRSGSFIYISRSGQQRHRPLYRLNCSRTKTIQTKTHPTRTKESVWGVLLWVFA